MALDKDLTWQRLDNIWKDTNVKTLETKGKKYAIISDTHMGNGGEADDFEHNERALLNALEEYLEDGYTLILLGDIEEFWQFDLVDVLKRYGSRVYPAIQKFGDERVIRVFGNHDYEWGGMLDPIRGKPVSTGVA